MKIILYPKGLLEMAWHKDRKLFTKGYAAAPPKCLRCGGMLAAHLPVNTLSRYADVHICESCGMDEALRDASHTPLSLMDWDSVKQNRLPERKKDHICYLKTVCTFKEVFQHTYRPPMQLIKRPVSEIVYSRSDYDGYKWWTTWHNESGQEPASELVKEIDDFQNALFKMPAFKTLDTLRCFCWYAHATSDPTEFDLYSETGHLYIWVRLITRIRDYNVYVHYYGKVAASDKAEALQ